MPDPRRQRPTTAAVLALAAAGLIAGCGQVSERPQVGSSAAELYAEPPIVRPVSIAGGEARAQGAADTVASADLNFFDELTTRSLASNDDAIHAALLLAVGRSASSFRERLDLASKTGLIEETYDRPGREAATIGETSAMLVRVVDGPQRISQERAVARMVAQRLLPAGAEAFQGLTGAQLVTLVGGVADMLRSQGRDFSLPAPLAAPSPIPTAAPAPIDPAAPPPPGTQPDPAPTIAPITNPPAIEPTPAPAEPAPTPAPTPAAEPAPFSPGTPIRRPGGEPTPPPAPQPAPQ
jgi:hypothetical protein